MKKVIISALSLAPVLAFAQGGGPQLGNIETFIRSVGRLVNIALPIVVGIALLGFFWGLAQYVFAAGDEEKKKTAKQHMIWGIIALFVMVSVWGLVGFIGSAIGVGSGSSYNPPDVDVPGVQNSF